MASIGTDIEQISRVEQIIARTPRFKEKLFTAAERAYCDAKARPAQHYTARFCAKEAFAKAVATPLAWQEVEVIRGETGPPVIHAHGEAAKVLNGRTVHVTLSHAGDYAIAMVLIED